MWFKFSTLAILYISKKSKILTSKTQEQERHGRQKSVAQATKKINTKKNFFLITRYVVVCRPYQEQSMLLSL